MVESGTAINSPVSGMCTLDHGGVLMNATVNGSVSETTTASGAGTYDAGSTFTGTIVSPDGAMTNGRFTDAATVSSGEITAPVELTGTATLTDNTIINADLTTASGTIANGIPTRRSEIDNVELGNVPNAFVDGLTMENNSSNVITIRNDVTGDTVDILQGSGLDTYAYISAFTLTIEGPISLTGTATLYDNSTITGSITGDAELAGDSSVGSGGGTATGATISEERTVIGTVDVNSSSQIEGTTVGTVSVEGGSADTGGTISNVEITRRVMFSGEVSIPAGQEISDFIQGVGTIQGGKLQRRVRLSSPNIECR